MRIIRRVGPWPGVSRTCVDVISRLESPIKGLSSRRVSEAAPSPHLLVFRLKPHEPIGVRVLLRHSQYAPPAVHVIPAQRIKFYRNALELARQVPITIPVLCILTVGPPIHFV